MLPKGIRLSVVVALVIMLGGVAQAAPSPGVTKEDLKEIMPISQVRAGMKGYGLTVFKGTKIERFDVQVLGILRKANAGKDLIVVKVSGGPITGRRANIIQGMSGSPVFINGRIVGAVAYGQSFPKEPIGMLTPIEDMLDSLDPKLPARPSGLSSPLSTLDSPVEIGGKTITRVEIRGPGASGGAAKGTLVMTPLMTPLMVSGMSSRGISKLADLLEPYGITPMAGPGSKADPVPVQLKPGAALGMSLATGDIDMTAVGTLTYRRGKKIVAFGHPFMGVGPIDAPMTTAYVHDIFPGYQASSKIASPMKVVGRLFEDRPWSVGGEIGKMPKMIPVTVDIDDQVIGRKRTMHVNVLNHPLLAPRLLPMVTAEAISDVHGLPGDAMARVSLQIDADQIGKILRDNTFFDPSSVETASMDDLEGLVSILANNRFHPVDVKNVHMSVTITSGRKTASIERIFVNKSKYEPGEAIDVGVELRPYKAEKMVKTVQIRVPESAADGRVTLQVRGGMFGGMEWGAVLALGPEGPRIVAPGGAGTGTAETVRQMVDKYLEREKNSDLVVKLQFPASAVSVSGEKLAGLPDTVASVMKSSRSSGLKQEREEVKVVQATDCIVTGGQSLAITVQRRRLGEKKPSTSPSTPESSPQPEATSPSVAPSPPVSEADEDQGEDFAALGSDLQVEAVAPAPPAAPAKDKAAAPSSDKKSKSSEGTKTPPTSDTKTGTKTETKTEAKPEQKAAEKPVARQPSVWRQTSYQDFSLGTFASAAATTADDVRLVPSVGKLASLPETYVWQVIPDGQGGVYAGTGNNGIVYRVTKDGAASVFFKTGELEVHSLARDSKGVLYAGTSPNGKVYRVEPDGKGKAIYDAPEKYILALAVDSRDNVYAGAGDAGKVYRIAPGGESKLFAKLPEASVLSLAVGKSDDVCVGTAKDGVVYKIAPDGTVSAVYNAAEDSIPSLAVDASGNVYAGTGSGKGNLYKIPASGAAKAVFDKAPRALSLAVDAVGNAYAVSDDQIFKVTADEKVMALDTRRAGVQFVTVAVDKDGTIYAGTANTGAVYRSANAAEATYDSPVHDASLPARWGAVDWIANTPEGTSVSIQTRTGNVADPDATWSEWSPAIGAPGQVAASPPGRYMQYRATLEGAGAASPALEQVTIAYLTENRPPKVTMSEPQTGAVIARTQSIKWSGTDPDKDTLTYDVYYSADAGKTWQPLGSGIKQPKNGTEAVEPKKEKEEEQPGKQETKEKDGAAAAPDGAPSADELLSQLKSELDKHPEIPQETKDKMLAEAPGAIDKAIDSASKPESETASEQDDSGPSQPSTKQTSHNWDTTKVPDGSYLIKVVATDRTSNAVGFLTDEKVIGPVAVCNTPPKLTAAQQDVKVGSDGTVTLSGAASDALAAIAGVQYKVDSGDWMAAAAADGIFDSKSEGFTVTTQPLAKGKHTIEVKAIDAAGNAASAKVTAEVP